MLYEGFCCFTWFIAAVIVSWWFRFGSIGSVLIVDTCCNTFRLCMVWNEHREPQLTIKLVTWTTCKLVVCLVKERKVLKILRSLVGVLLSGVLLSSYSPKLPYFIAAEHSVWKSSNVVATKMLKTPGTASSSGLGLETWWISCNRKKQSIEIVRVGGCLVIVAWCMFVQAGVCMCAWIFGTFVWGVDPAVFRMPGREVCGARWSSRLSQATSGRRFF